MENTPEISALLATIVQSKERAEAAAIAAEAASSKANSESGFAFNAKQYAEDHAKAISQVRGAIDAESSGVATIKKNVEDTANAVAAIKAAADAGAQTVAEKKAQIEKDSAIAKSVTEQSTALLPIIEKAKTDIVAALQVANEAVASISSSKSNSESSATTIQALQKQIADVLNNAKTTGDSITKIDEDSKVLFAAISEVVQTANTAQDRVTRYENKLAEMTEAYAALSRKIEGLLPNATSAGLASAFRNQKERFKTPQRNWLWTFLASIISLLAVGMIGAPTIGTGDSWDAIFRHLTIRSPLIVPLVWLGIYAGRNYMLALRVEEEYAFKEAVSTAFEGYKREMAGITAGGNDDAPPLIVLCDNVLRALSQRPGRIYEGRHEDITPLSPVKSIFGFKKSESAAKADASAEKTD